MKKHGILLICTMLAALAVCAQETNEPEKINANAFLVQKEIQTWRSDQENGGRALMYNCQAVRIHPQWLLTAAHCVYKACHGSFPCTVQATLVEDDLHQMARVSHAPGHKRVFIYDGFFPGQNRISSVDAALVWLNPDDTEYAYEAKQNGQWKQITKAQFEKMLPDFPESYAQYKANEVRLIGAVDLPNARFLPQIVVPRVTNGVISYVPSAGEVFFVRDLSHFMTAGLSVRRGNSGGGVFTAKGDLAGVVSAMMTAADGSATFQDEDGKALRLQHANEHFLFTGFNAATLNFIRTTIPSIRVIGAENGFIRPMKKTPEFQSLIQKINTTPLKM